MHQLYSIVGIHNALNHSDKYVIMSRAIEMNRIDSNGFNDDSSFK